MEHSYAGVRGTSGWELDERLALRLEGVEGSGLRKGGFECSVSGAGADDERR